VGIFFSFFTGEIGWSSGTTGGVVVDGVLLAENDDYFIMENDDYIATE
jgi:hypothetical protein